MRKKRSHRFAAHFCGTLYIDAPASSAVAVQIRDRVLPFASGIHRTQLQLVSRLVGWLVGLRPPEGRNAGNGDELEPVNK